MEIQKLKAEFKEFVIRCIMQQEYHPLKNHLVFADPRGGSTWLMEVIQSITQEAVVWEPLNLGNKNKDFINLGFSWRQYIPESVDWPEAKEAFQNLFSGKRIDQSTFHHSTLYQCFNSKSLLFKICRGNILLPWLTLQFPFEYKPVYMIRHPFAVVSSQLRHGGWSYDFNGFEIPHNPYREIYLQHENFLNTLTTKAEALVAIWCVCNNTTLHNSRNNKDWLTINYEETVLHPVKTLDRITKSWGIDFNPEKVKFTKKSASTKQSSATETKKRLSLWKENLDKEQVKKMTRVLEYFEVTAYSPDIMPQIIYNYG